MRSLLTILALLCTCSILTAEPGPGDIFREYLWKGPWRNASGWQRVTDPEAAAAGAHSFLPNPINRVEIDDLDQAVRVEIYIEQWGGHAGTSAKRLRLNDHDWIDVPEPAGIPGDAGRKRVDDPQCYQYFSYPSVSVPLEQLLEGENVFEFTAGPQTCFNFNWGQWGVYGVTFRIYYDQSRDHPSGRIIAPAAASSIGDSIRLEATASSPNGAIEQVDFIGHYEDFDYEGNGIYRQWHYRYRYGRIKNHLGTATEAPYTTTWNTAWVPDQDTPIHLMARIKDESGLFYMTESIDDLALIRPDRSVKLYKPFNVPGRWQTRAWRTDEAKIFIGEDLSKATAARMLLTTWSGGHADAIGINDSSVIDYTGLTHNYSFDIIPVALELIQSGTNTFFTFAKTSHHGIEVLWPGIVLMVQYSAPPEPPPLPTTDLPILADALTPNWHLQQPSDTHTDFVSTANAFAGQRSLSVQPSGFIAFFLDIIGDNPVPTTGYTALRFAFHPNDMEVRGGSPLKLHINDQAIDLLENEQMDLNLDLELRQWQPISIPLETLSLRFPYLETLRFEGRLTGTFLLDDIHLVAARNTAILEETTAPSHFTLAQNYPNPFNSSTTIKFTLPQEQNINLSIYNLAGQKITTLAQGPWPPGPHTLPWNGLNSLGHPLASGVYLYRLQTTSQLKTKKMLLLR